MSRTLKVLGCLQTYPTAELTAALPEFRDVLLSESRLSGKATADVNRLMDWMEEMDLLDLQEEYVALFDRTPSLALYLFEHVYGESRERGQALVDLDMIYREAGLQNASEHTPDYLPLFLEYLSMLPLEQAQEELEAAIDIVGILGERLKKRESPYEGVMSAIEEIAKSKPDAALVQKALEAANGQLPDQDEVDAAWEEQFAMEVMSEGGKGGGCPMAEQALARMAEFSDKETV